MRFSSRVLGLLGVSYVPSALSSSACMLPEPVDKYKSWYLSMVYTAQNYVATVSDNTIPMSDDNESPSFVGSYTPVNIYSLDDLTDAFSDVNCAPVALKFVNAVASRLATQDPTGGTNCPTGMWDQGSADNWNSYKCIRLILAATEEFNTDASNGYDIVTGEPNRRCTVSDYTNLEALFMPFPSIVGLAYEDAQSQSYSPSTYVSRVIPVTDIEGPNFADTMLGLPEGVLGKTCSPCLDEFYTDVYDLFLSNSDAAAACANPHLIPKDSCKTALKAANNRLHNCIGGLYVHYQHPIPQCTTDEWKMFDGVFEAYQAVAACSDRDGSDFNKCVTDLNGIPLGINESGCLACWSDLGDKIRQANAHDCVISPLSDGCLAAIDGTAMPLATLADAGMFTPLTEFHICSGHAIDVAPTQCTEAEIASIQEIKLNWFDLSGVAMNAVDEADAVLLATTQLHEVITLSNCASSFKSLVAQIYRHSIVLGQSCVEPEPSEACIEDLTNLKLIQAFNTNSGMDLIALLIPPTPAPETTTEEVVPETTTEVSGVSETITSVSIGIAVASLIVRM